MTQDTEMREMRKIWPVLKVIGVCLGIPAILGASVQSMLRLPGTVQMHERLIQQQEMRIETTEKVQQDQREVLGRLDERGKLMQKTLEEQQQSLREIVVELRRK
jgi:hypothetical protein